MLLIVTLLPYIFYVESTQYNVFFARIYRRAVNKWPYLEQQQVNIYLCNFVYTYILNIFRVKGQNTKKSWCTQQNYNKPLKWVWQNIFNKGTCYLRQANWTGRLLRSVSDQYSLCSQLPGSQNRGKDPAEYCPSS